MKISDYIPTGEANAISNKQVAVLAKCTPREVRRLVEQARQEGEPICSCDNGYFIAETADELRRMLRKHYHQINTMIATARGLEHALLEMSE